VKVGHWRAAFPEIRRAGLVFLFASYFSVTLPSCSVKARRLAVRPLRNCTDWGQARRRLAKGKNLSAAEAPPREVELFVPRGRRQGRAAAQRIKARALQGLGAEEAIKCLSVEARHG